MPPITKVINGQPVPVDLGSTATIRTSAPDNPANAGASGRAQQAGAPTSRQQGPIHSNKPLDTLVNLILPPTGSNRVSAPVPPHVGGPVTAASGHIWPRIDYSENLQTSSGAAFTAAQFAAFAASYVSFAVPHTLHNRKIYAYINTIFPNVGASGVIIAQINLYRNGKLLTQFPISLYGGTANTGGFKVSIPFICGSGQASYDTIGLNLHDLAAGETSPVALVPLLLTMDIDKISVDLDTVNSTPTNISSLRIWVGCISF